MQVIKGPELLNMWHGITKGNVRNLFSEAISEYKKYGKDYKFERDLLYILLEHVLTILYFPPFFKVIVCSPLHIIVFDELDSIAKVKESNFNYSFINYHILIQYWV